jgi:hypothetical protein
VILSEPERRRFPARALAVVVAVVLVAGSLAFRQLVLEDDDNSGSGGGGNGGDGPLRVACVEELEDVCADLDAEIVVEPAGDTAARLVEVPEDEDADIDAWITYAPWPEIVDARREIAGVDPLLANTGEPIGRSPLVIAARQDRAAVLTAHCNGVVTWTCVGEVAGTPWTSIGGEETWGVVRPAHAEPLTSGTGLLVLGAVVASFVATPETDADHISRIDWEANDAFPGWFQNLERSVPVDAFTPGRDPLGTWLQRRLIGYDLVATTEAAALTSLAAAAPDIRDDATVLYPAPVATADVVLAPVAGGRNATGLEEDLTEALIAAGYRTDGNAPPGAPALPETDGLPTPGALDALRGLWEGVAR